MSLQNTTEPAIPRAQKPKHISERLKKALALLQTGECTTQRAACARVGMNETHFSQCLSRPDVQAYMVGEARKTIARGAMPAANRVLKLALTESGRTALEASKYVLGCAGIKPDDRAQVSVNIQQTIGYVIKLREPAPMSHMRDVTPKPLIDNEAK